MLSLLLAFSAGSAQIVSGDVIALKVWAKAEELLATHGSAKIRSLKGVLDQIVPEGELGVQVMNPAGRFPRARVPMSIQITVDGRTVRTLTAWLEIEDPREVLVYTSRYSRAHDSADIGVVTGLVDMTCCVGSAVRDLQDVKGLRLKRGVKQGQPVLLADFESVPEVAFRQPVLIEAARGEVMISLRGTAMGDGHLGGKVAVRTPLNGRTLRATVTGPQRVRIDD